MASEAEVETLTITAGDSTMRELPPGTQVGRYKILEVLGVGGMAIVYRARDPYLSRDVALKLLHEHRRLLPQASHDYGRLLREAQALAKLSHPNVVAAFDVGAHDGAVFLAMELVEGETLRAWLDHSRPLHEIVQVLLGAARGLAAAHDAGVLHRDFTPRNVVVSPAGTAHVVDFGLARDTPTALHHGGDDKDAGGDVDAAASGKVRSRDSAMPATAVASELTSAGAVMGTPGFMAPEQAAGTPADERADQFGFAATAFYALTGREPFPGKGGLDGYRAALRRERAPWPATIDRRVRRVIDRGLALAPEDRWPNMATLVAELVRATSFRRQRAIAIGLAVAMLAIALTVVVARRTRGGEEAVSCTGDGSAFDGAWNRDRRAKLEAAFRAHGTQLASETFAIVAARLDAARTRWLASRRDACEDTHVRREQTERIEALRYDCLDAKRSQVAELVTALSSTTDASQVDRAVGNTLEIGDVRACEDITALLDEGETMPTAPAVRVGVQLAARAIDEAGVVWRTGRYDPARAILAKQVAALQSLGHPATEARARMQLALVLNAQGHIDEALAELERALALSARLRRLHAEVSVALLAMMVRERRMPQAEAILPHVDASVKAAGSPPKLQLALLLQQGATRAFLHDFTAADTALRSAQLICAGLSDIDPTVERSCIRVQEELGILALEQEDLPRAAETFQSALAATKTLYGPHHPVLIATYMNWITAVQEQGQKDKALAILAEAREVTASLPPTLPHRARLDLLEGTVWQEAGKDCAQAAVHYRKAIDGFATDVRNRTIAHLRLGRCLVATGDAAAGAAELQIVVDQRKREDAPLLWQGEVMFDLARALWQTPATRPRARLVAREAMDTYTAAGADGADLAAEVRAWMTAPR